MKARRKVKRQIIRIDEEKCTGCGLCVPACAEGALKIIDGKARLVSEIYCDGLGACLGVCPEGAITIEEREALEFDPKEVEAYQRKSAQPEANNLESGRKVQPEAPCCPGSKVMAFSEPEHNKIAQGQIQNLPSSLSNWPVQIRLIPPQAPFLHQAKLLISADCVPFAFNGFHNQFLEGRVVMIGCPKLDDADFYFEKLSQIFFQNEIQEIEVVYMEVPCCTGLVRLVKMAMERAGKKIPIKLTQIAISGEILEAITND